MEGKKDIDKLTGNGAERRAVSIEICSRRQIERVSQKPFPDHTALFSISDLFSMPPRLKHRPKWRLSLAFDDIRQAEANSAPIQACRGCNQEDAERIAAFISRVWGKADRIVCQCEAGVSRSAAVGDAICEQYFKDGAAVFSDPAYDPDPVVYRLVLEQMQRIGGMRK